jgi:hypothetical protein
LNETERTRGRETYPVHPLFPWAHLADVDWATMAGFPGLIDARWITPEERARARRRRDLEIAELDRTASAGSGSGSHARRSYIEALGSVLGLPIQVYAVLRGGVSRSARALFQVPGRFGQGLARPAGVASDTQGHELKGL